MESISRHWSLLCLLLLCKPCHGMIGKFNEAFTASMLDKVYASMAVPWTPLESVASTFSSDWFFSEDGSESLEHATNTSMSVDEDIRRFLWTMLKPYAEGSNTQVVDALYVGLMSGKLVAYTRAPDLAKKPAYLLYCKDRNETCPVGSSLAGEFPCMSIYYNRTDASTGNPTPPGPSGYALFDPTSRPWYQQSASSTRVAYAGSNKAAGAVGAIWSDPYLFTTGVVGLTAARQLFTSAGVFVGVAGADYELGTLQETLADSTSTSSGTLTVFVVDSQGFLISSSIPGAALSVDESSLLRATACTDKVIAAVARDVMHRQEEGRAGSVATNSSKRWDDFNGTVTTLLVPLKGLHWYQSLPLVDPYGLRWHVVVAERAQCDRGFFVPTDYEGEDCEECPAGAECLGGMTMPLPLPGYWIDRSEYAHGGEAYPCARGSCVGFRHKASNFLERASSGLTRLGDDDAATTTTTADDCVGDDCLVQIALSSLVDDGTLTSPISSGGSNNLPTELVSCFTFEAFVNASHSDLSQDALEKCSDEASLQCSHGASGPLCGSCENGFTFSTATRACVKCGVTGANVAALVLALVFIASVFAFVVRRADGKAYLCGNDRGATCCTLKGTRGDEDDDDDDDDDEEEDDEEDEEEEVAVVVDEEGGLRSRPEDGTSSSPGARTRTKKRKSTLAGKGGGGGGSSGSDSSGGVLKIAAGAMVFGASSSSSSSTTFSRSNSGDKGGRGAGAGGGRCWAAPAWVQRLNLFRHVDRGMLKVLWSTAQILSTISWNLALHFPAPFSDMLTTLSFSELDFSSLDCYVTSVDLVSRVYFASLIPLALVAVDVLVYFARMYRLRRKVSLTPKPLLFSAGLGTKRERRRARWRIANDATYFALLLSYLVLPPVAMIQFHAMDCTRIGDLLVLHMDTSVNCLSSEYKRFVVFNAFLIAVYQSVPLVWWANLWHIRHRLNPASRSAMAARERAAAEAAAKGEDMDEEDYVYSSPSPPPPSLLGPSSMRRSRGSISEPHRVGLMQNIFWQPPGWLRHSIGAAARDSSHNHNHRLSAGGAGKFGPYRAAGGAAAGTIRIHGVDLSDESAVLEARSRDPTIRHLAFLWKDYRPEAWYFEVVDVYRRILFTGALPLLAPIGLARIALGCLFSVALVAVVREIAPFNRRATNTLLVTGQYQILVTFLAAFTIASGTVYELGLSGFALGVLLVLVNVAVVGLAALLLVMRWKADEEKSTWRRKLHAEELEILNRIMCEGVKKQKQQAMFEPSETTSATARFSDDGSGAIELRSRAKSSFSYSGRDLGGGGGEGGRGGALSQSNASSRTGSSSSSSNRAGSSKSLSRHGSSGSAPSANELLSRYLLRPKDVKLDHRVGAGSFGEVFFGTCLGQPVAVKTMLNVTEDSVLSFRSEILLTATLRHPNIVNFVGACWGEDLPCLVLEWVSNGSLGDLLQPSSAASSAALPPPSKAGKHHHHHHQPQHRGRALTWDEPLLRLATDVARGMAYLHGREFFDEVEEEHKKCIIHRDLKPDNALVTEYLRAKITDFGTSRAKTGSASSLAMTSVGTPLYCAPEVVRGDPYDEGADVYSFGLLLLEMCVDSPFIAFLSERWRVSFGKKKPPLSPMKVIRAMIEDGWRPVQTFAAAAAALDSAPPLIAAETTAGVERSGEPHISDANTTTATTTTTTAATSDSAASTASTASTTTPSGQQQQRSGHVPPGPIAHAPPALNDLAVRCCAHDPSDRPCFEDILAELLGPCSAQVEKGSFGRSPREGSRSEPPHPGPRSRAPSSSSSSSLAALYPPSGVQHASASSPVSNPILSKTPPPPPPPLSQRLSAAPPSQPPRASPSPAAAPVSSSKIAARASARAGASGTAAGSAAGHQPRVGGGGDQHNHHHDDDDAGGAPMSPSPSTPENSAIFAESNEF